MQAAFQQLSSHDAGSSSSSAPLPLAQPPVQLPPVQKWAIVGHTAFKAIAVLLYLLSDSFLHNYALTFVLVTLCSAVDFWTTKNISGRLLVGLRWWNVIDERGESHWRFESYEDQRFIHPTDSNAFWLPLFIGPGVWALLAVGAVITLHFMWLVLVIVAFMCNIINTIGYTKCKKDASKKLTALGGTVLTRGMAMFARSASAEGKT